MTTKTRVRIITHEDQCVGCRICQFWCSFQLTKKFTPSIANIQIEEPYGLSPKISFLDSCTKCGQCVDHCLYGALEILKEGM